MKNDSNGNSDKVGSTQTIVSQLDCQGKTIEVSLELTPLPITDGPARKTSIREAELFLEVFMAVLKAAEEAESRREPTAN
jgi:uncharacterized lipoprotein NlpE involved in copper resistance